MSLHIRPARREDAAQILAFITELADYQRARDEVVASLDDIQRGLFDQDSTAKALIAERDGQAIGFAVYFFSYSTWVGRRGIYLEDLYVTPLARGTGAGKLLLRHLARLACEHDCARFEWTVLNWNQPAIDFYLSLGAEALDGRVRYRMEGETLRAFANG